MTLWQILDHGSAGRDEREGRKRGTKEKERRSDVVAGIW